ncbi:MAG: phage major tail tube protein [Xanthomonadaceae bacterium]|nr:phage major tail tube protein [Xanthomonadaceae bacterium]
MAARDIRKNLNLFVDGRGYAGQVLEFTPPVLALQVEDFRAGGMDASIEIELGMEKLESSFVLSAYDRNVLGLWGVARGSEVQFTLREAIESYDGTVKAVVHNLRGRLRKLDPGTSKPGEMANLTCEVALSFYKQTHDGRVVHEIDVINMVRVIDGVDRLAAQRAALGL